MTRFWLTIEQAVDIVLDGLAQMGGGETFVPRVPSMKITDMAAALAPGVKQRVIGLRPGEKLHEVLITEDESHHSFQTPEGYVILPEYASWELKPVEGGARLPEGFRFSSETNDRWLTGDELVAMTAGVRARRRDDAPATPPIDDAVA
jgi:UDP-N-acetylglucosamine 4,6-dehydratase